MRDVEPRTLRGPFLVVGLVVAAAWLALGVVGALRLTSPWNIVVAAVAVVATAVTAWISWGLRVKVADTGVSASGMPEIAWEDIEHVGVRSGLVAVPYLSVRRGRALDDMPLDGIAGLGTGMATRLAERLAAAGDLGDVVVSGSRRSGGGRRAIRE